jgi:hypothetical protein
MGYYLFILSIILYILIILDFNYEWKITGLFLVFSTIILFESALYLSAPFAQYEEVDITVGEDIRDERIRLESLFKEYVQIFKESEKLFFRKKIDFDFKVEKKIEPIVDSFMNDTKELYSNYKKANREFKVGYFQAFDYLLKSFDEENIKVIVKNSFAYQHEPYLVQFIEYLLGKEKNILFIFNTEQERDLIKEHQKKIFNSDLFLFEDMLSLHGKTKDELKHAIIADTTDNLNRYFHKVDNLQHINLIIILDLDTTLDKYVTQTNLLLYKIKDFNSEQPSILGFSKSSSLLESSFHNQFPIVGSNIEEIKIEQTKDRIYMLGFKSEFEPVKQTFGKHIPSATHIEDITALSWLALKKHVKSIKLSSSGFVDMENDVGLFKSALAGSDVGRRTSYLDIYKNHYLKNLTKKDKLFILDDRYNLAYTVQKWLSYTLANEIFLIIVSPRYLLREYIGSNIEFFMEQAYIKDFLLYGTLEEKKIAYLLYRRLKGGFTNRESVARSLNKRAKEITKFDIIEFLNKLLDLSLDEDNIEFEDRDIFENGKFKTIRHYQIAIEEGTTASIDSQPYRVVAHGDGTPLGIDIHEEDIYTRYFPKQIHLFDDKIYRIENIERGEIRVVSTIGEEIPQYRAKKSFVMKIDESKQIESKGLDGYKIVYYEHFGSFNFSVNRYYEYFAQGGPTYQDILVRKEFNRQSFFQIDIIRNDSFDESTRFAFVCLLNELLYTLFPNNYHLVDIMTQYSNSEYDSLYFPDLRIENGDERFDEKTLSLYIVESTEIDMGLHKTFIDNFLKMILIIDDFLVWLQENQEKNFLEDIKLEGISLMSKLGDISSIKEITFELLGRNNNIAKDRKTADLKTIHSDYID